MSNDLRQRSDQQQFQARAAGVGGGGGSSALDRAHAAARETRDILGDLSRRSLSGRSERFVSGSEQDTGQ